MAEMLKVRGSYIKETKQPSNATVQAMPVGHEARRQKWAEEDARAREFREEKERQRIERQARAKERAEEKAKKKAEAYENYRSGEPYRLWDNYIEIATIQKSAKLRLVVAACTRNGFRCVSVREFFYKASTGEWFPSRKGILIPTKVPLSFTSKPDPNNPPKMIYPLQEFIPALLQAVDIATVMELADDENAVWIQPKTKHKEKQDEDQ